MKRFTSSQARDPLGAAELAEELAKVNVIPVEGVTCRLVRFLDEAPPVEVEITEPYAFKLIGCGMPDATFFVARETHLEKQTNCRPLFAVSELTFAALLPGTSHYSERDWAVQAAIKFVLRIPEEGRADAWERMKAFDGVGRVQG